MWEPGQSLSPAALTPEGGIMSWHRGTALWLVFWGVVLGLALGLARLAPAQRTDRDASATATRRRPRRPASAAPWSASSRSWRRTPAAARRSIASTAITSSAARSMSFIKSYRDRLAKDRQGRHGWLILGLLEFQRGQDAAAVTALRQAEAIRAEDPLPPYYLGQALVLVGQPEQAADAFERALRAQARRATTCWRSSRRWGGCISARRNPTRRWRSGPGWRRCSRATPACRSRSPRRWPRRTSRPWPCPRFEALAKSVKDPFRQVQLAMQAAELKVRLGRTDQALKDFEAMLGKLRPDSWLHQEVRRKIEEVFLRNDDQRRPGDVLREMDEAGARGRRGARAAGPDAGHAWAGSPRRSPGTRRRSSWLPAVATSGWP